MATETVLDDLDAPTQIAQALDLFDEPTREARPLKSSYLIHQIGRHLNELSAREERLHAVLQLAQKLVPNNTDFDDLRALLELTLSYDMESSRMRWEFSGQVLAALERGKLVGMNHA